jgi:glycosyltransferase involved in cell wall biosynthesis
MKTTTTKRRVLFFVPVFPVLTETFIEAEIIKLSERGNIDVRVLALEGSPEKINVAIKDKVLFKRLNFGRALLGTFLVLIKLPAFFCILRLINHLKISLWSKIFRVFKYFGYATIVMGIKPDLLVAHFMSEPSTIGMAVSVILNIPFGISAHARDVTVDAECVPEKISLAKFVLVCNKNAQKHLIQLNNKTDSEKIILHYHGIDVNKLAERAVAPAEKPDKAVVVSVGRLVEKKGHGFLIEASKILLDRGVDHQIYIIGPGEMYKELTEKINTAGVSSNVKILGRGKGLPLNEALGYIQEANVGVFSGIRTDWGDVDGIPNSILEYAAFKVPVVSTDAGSTTDLIDDEKTGLLVPQKNPVLLADKIEVLIFNNVLAKELTDNAYLKLTEKFDINKNIVDLEKLLL